MKKYPTTVGSRVSITGYPDSDLRDSDIITVTGTILGYKEFRDYAIWNIKQDDGTSRLVYR